MCKCNLGWERVTYHIRVTVTLTSELVLETIELWSTSLIFFGVGIPKLVCKCIMDGNLVCECILELWIVLFHFPVTVTLTSDLVSRICIKSGTILLLFFEVGIPNYTQVNKDFLGWTWSLLRRFYFI